jgi:HlyD family secretion protein
MKINQTFLKYGLFLLAGGFAAYAILHALSNKNSDKSAKPIIEPVNVPVQTATQFVAGSGIVQPSSELFSLIAPVSGTVKTVRVQVGEPVKSGQILIEFDDTESIAEIKTRESAISLAKANLQSAQIELNEKLAAFKLYSGIEDQRAVVQEELQNRRYAAQSAQARLAAAQAAIVQNQSALGQARVNQALRSVKAPIDATILSIKAHQGEYFAQGNNAEPMLTLGNINPLHVKVDIDEIETSKINFDAPVSLSPRGSPQMRITGTLIRIEPVIQPKKSLTNATNERVDTRVLQIIYALPSNVKGFFVGQQIDAFVPSLRDSKAPQSK